MWHLSLLGRPADHPYLGGHNRQKSLLQSLSHLSSATRDCFRVRHRPFSSGGEKGSKCPTPAARNTRRDQLSCVEPALSSGPARSTGSTSVEGCLVATSRPVG